MWWNVTWTCFYETPLHVAQYINRKWLNLNSFPSPCNRDWHQTLVLAWNHLTNARTKTLPAQRALHTQALKHRCYENWYDPLCIMGYRRGGKRSGQSATQVHSYLCSALQSKLQKQQKWNEKQTGAVDWRNGYGVGEEWRTIRWRKSSGKRKCSYSLIQL